MKNIRRISFFEDLGNKKATIAYFLQEGHGTCNVSCKGCYAGAGQVSFNTEKGIINPEEAYTDISALLEEYRVLIRGTEIIMNPDYIPLLKLAENKIILTNGILLSESLDILAENQVSNIAITYPFENTPSTQRSLSTLLHHKKKIQEGILKTKQHDFPFILQLSAIITKDCIENSKCLEKICEEAISLGTDVIRFVPYVPMSGDSQVDKYALSINERKKLIDKITELKRYYQDNLIIHTPGVLGLFSYRAEKKKEIKNIDVNDNKLICPAGQYYFAISTIKKRDKKTERIYRPINLCHFRMDFQIGQYFGGKDLQINKFIECKREDCLAQIYWVGIKSNY